jgi:hypothetical protein
MIDDPTTKPCPDCSGQASYDVPCHGCGITGRVPMTTAELLEALAERGMVTLQGGYTEGGWTCACSGVQRDRDDRDECLRDTLRAVTPCPDCGSETCGWYGKESD